MPVPLIRPHSECLTGDVFGSQRCDCGAQLREAVERVARAGGYLLYLRQEGRGIGLYSKVDAYLLQDEGLDTYEANLALGHAEDERDYTVAAQMLTALDVPRIALLTNNPDKAAQLTRLGITVTAQVPTAVHLSATNAGYLETKAWRGAHTLYLTHNDRRSQATAPTSPTARRRGVALGRAEHHIACIAPTLPSHACGSVASPGVASSCGSSSRLLMFSFSKTWRRCVSMVFWVTNSR